MIGIFIWRKSSVILNVRNLLIVIFKWLWSLDLCRRMRSITLYWWLYSISWRWNNFSLNSFCLLLNSIDGRFPSSCCESSHFFLIYIFFFDLIVLVIWIFGNLFYSFLGNLPSFWFLNDGMYLFLNPLRRRNSLLGLSCLLFRLNSSPLLNPLVEFIYHVLNIF